MMRLTLVALLLATGLAHAATPDIQGPWIAPKAVTRLTQQDGTAPPLTARGKELQAQHQGKATDPMARCLPGGNPRTMNTVGFPFNIVQGTAYYAIMFQWNHRSRVIYMDTAHFRNLGPGYFGQSVGHWEGDTLVVETNNVRPGTFDRNGVPYSDKLTAVERYRRVSPQRLEVETVLTDPEAFLVPYTIKRAYVPMPAGSRFEEYLCENNRDYTPTGSKP